MASREELRAAYETEVKSLNEAVEAVSAETVIEGSNVTIPEKGYNEVKRLKNNVRELEGLLTAEHKSYLKDVAEEGESAASRFAQGFVERKSVADSLFDSEEYKEMISQGRSAMRDDVKIEAADIASLQTKDVFTQMDAGTSPRGYGIVHQELPMVTPKYLQSRVRDLFPKASTSANYLEYFKSVGWTEDNPNNAGFYRERAGADGTSAPTGADTDVFGLKPKSNIKFSSASDPVRGIAHWVAAHRNALSDKPAIRSIIDNELLYGLKFVEDDALLNGDGTNETLLGLLNREGIQHYDPSMAPTVTQADQMSDTVRRALTRVELAFFPSTGVVLHPLDWEKLELQKDGNGNYMIATSVAVGGTKRLWQVPVVSTPAIAEGTFLTGAFGQAAQVYDREQASIRVAEQHADFFVRNAVVILAEERLALTTPRPEGLVHGSFEAAESASPTP